MNKATTNRYSITLVKMLACCLCILTCISCKKSVSPEKNGSSVRIIGGSGRNEVNYITEHPDGGWLIFGITNVKGNGGSDIYEAYIDTQMNLVFDTTYGSFLNEEINANSVFKDRDGNILVGGYTQQLLPNTGTDSFAMAYGMVYKFDPYGKLLHKTIIPDNAGISMTNYRISQLPSGNYTVFGANVYYTEHCYIYELTADLQPTENFFSGDIPRYSNTYTLGYTYSELVGNMLIDLSECDTGQFIIQRFTLSAGALTQEEDTLACPGIPEGYYYPWGLIAADKDNLYVNFSWRGSYIVKVTAGKTDWTTQLGQSGNISQLYTNHEGDCYGSIDDYFFKVNKSGSIAWEKIIPGVAEKSGLSGAICINKDKSITIAYATQFAGYYGTNIGIMVLDDNGDSIFKSN